MNELVVVATGLGTLLGLYALLVGFVKHFSDPITKQLDSIASSGEITATEVTKMNEQLKGVHEKIDNHSNAIDQLDGRVTRNREDIIQLKETIFIKQRD